MAWILLTISVIANVGSNVMFKMAMAEFPADPTLGSLFRFAFNPYLWIGGLSCVALLASYLLALRDVDLTAAYAFTISLSLIGIALVTALMDRELPSLATIGGGALIITGLMWLTLGNAHQPAGLGADADATVAAAPVTTRPG